MLAKCATTLLLSCQRVLADYRPARPRRTSPDLPFDVSSSTIASFQNLFLGHSGSLPPRNLMINPPANSSLSATKQALDAFLALDLFVRKNAYRGYEFDDFLASPFLSALTLRKLLLQRVMIQVGELLPVNLRPLLGVPRLESTKARGFFAKGYLLHYMWDKDEKWLAYAAECLDWLLKNSAKGFRGLSWGNAFDFASRSGFMPAGLPTVVWTSHIAESFELAYSLTQKQEHLTALQKSAEFVQFSLPRHESVDGCCIGYTPRPGPVSQIHNSSLLGAATLLRAWRYFGGDEALQIARQAYRWSLARMNPDGSWFYGVGDKWRWIDSFHTAYNIDCLLVGHDIGGEEVVPWKAVERTVHFWLKHFFLPDGAPKYYAERAFPFDIQCAAQAIETASKLAARFPEAGPLAEKVLGWTLPNMQKRNGAFRYQRRPLWKNNLESIHWGQATMLSALGSYLCGSQPSRSRENGKVACVAETVGQESRI